jgi:predicted peroxiredoxin
LVRVAVPLGVALRVAESDPEAEIDFVMEGVAVMEGVDERETAPA